MQITWFGHSAFRLDFAGNAVLIDPFFTGNPAFVSDKAAAMTGVGHIVLTHGHGDHVGDALDIAKSNGAIVKARGEPVVYHMGDTDIFSDMALIAEIHQPKIAMVPIGDRFTMSPATAAIAVKRFFKLDAVVPCHYGSFPIIEANAETFVTEMKGHATRVIVPDKGKPFTV